MSNLRDDMAVPIKRVFGDLAEHLRRLARRFTDMGQKEHRNRDGDGGIDKYDDKPDRPSKPPLHHPNGSDSSSEHQPVKDRTYKRPSGYRAGVRDEVWRANEGSDGKVRDPETGRVINPEEPWVMGHKPGHKS